jgi:hypothetical protein
VQIQSLLKKILIVQLFGALMFAVVCAAYIFGIPTNNVLHNHLEFRIVLGFLGLAFFDGSILALAMAYGYRKGLAEINH